MFVLIPKSGKVILPNFLCLHRIPKYANYIYDEASENCPIS